jgi:hypothetical protein
LFQRRANARLVSRVVTENAPFLRCFRCLAREAGLSEQDTRDAGQRLIVRDEFFIDLRECPFCGRTAEVLVPGKAA